MMRLDPQIARKRAVFSRALSFLALFLLSACGGGLFDLAEGGIDGSGSGLSIGPISAFGSIVVNGTEYSTQQAEVFIGGVRASPAQLQLGMYVDVSGTHETTADRGTAERIEYRDTLRGQVEFVGARGRSLRVLGQTVQITDSTRLYGLDSVAALQAGDYVRISGPTATGGSDRGIAATLLERLPGTPGEAAIVGTVFGLDRATQSFFIAGLRIFYASARSLPPQLHNGMAVEVTGAPPARPDSLQAAQIRELALADLPPGSFTEITGSVTRFESLQDFDVEFRAARLPQDLAEELQPALKTGSQVSLVGFTDANGMIEIETLKVLDGSLLSGTPNDLLWRASGPLSALDMAGRSLAVSGVAAHLDDMTWYRDLSGNNPEFGLADLRLGDTLTIAGRADEAGEFRVSILQYEPFLSGTMRQIQGTASQINSPSRQLRVLGVPVSVHAATRYFDASQLAGFNLPPPGPPLVVPAETSVSAEAFFQRLSTQPDLLINVFGEPRGEAVLADTLILLPRGG